MAGGDETTTGVDWDSYIDRDAITVEYSPWSGGTPAGTMVWQSKNILSSYEEYIAGITSNSTAANAITRELISSGMVQAGSGADKFVSAYKQALLMTAQANATAGNNANVFEVMNLIGGGSPTSGGSGGTYKDVIRYTDDQVKQKAINAYTGILGTDPTDVEIAEFARALRAAAQAAPSIQKVSGSGKMRETTAGFDERAFIAGFMSTKVPDANADLGGAAGGIQDLIENYKQNYGVNPTAGFIQSAIKNIVKSTDPNAAKADLEAQLKEQAQILYPALRDKIQAGVSVRAIADPYISTFSKLMEKSDMSVGLDNNYVSKALSSKNDKGEYQIMDQNEFARQIRSSNEWLDTRNAKETMLSAADGILKQFGFKR